MIYREALKRAEAILKENAVEEAAADALYLLKSACGLTGASYLLKQNDEMDPKEEEVFFGYINRRSLREPCQYIVGSTEFMGLEFKVTPDVLIPRQDTEMLAEEAISMIKSTGASKVLDLCTGSGALAVSVKNFCKDVEMTASDISEKAIEVAKENAIANDADITFILSDMFENIDGRYDMIISNPPYVTEEEYEGLMLEVKTFEPKGALVSGPEGLDHYKIIASKAKEYLRDDGYLALEIGCLQAESVSGLLKEAYKEIKVIKDLTGKDRVITCKKA